MVLLIQALLTGAAVVMSVWAGMPWGGTVGLGLLGAGAMAAAAPWAARSGQAGIWGLAAAWAGTLLVLGSALLAREARAILSTYFDGYYLALAWIVAAAIWPASRRMSPPALSGRWRALVMLWAMLGGLAWVGASYLHNRLGAFLIGVLIVLVLLALCHFWFRLSMPLIVAVNTLILLIIGLPLTDLVVRCVDSLRADLEAPKQYYLYDAGKKHPAAFGRWWNYYTAQWRQAEKQIYTPDPDPGLTYSLRPNSRARVMRSAFGINSLGFRGREVSVDKGNAYRIVALGESTTFGVTLNAEDRPWPELLEQLIRERLKPRRPVEVINAGVPGYRLDMSLHRLSKDILPLKPDMIISYHGINGFPMLRDALPPVPGAATPLYKPRPLRLLADLEYRLKLIRFQHRQAPRHGLKHPEQRELGESAASPSPALKGTLSRTEGEREGVRGRASLLQPTPPQGRGSGVPNLRPATLADPLATPYAQLYRQLIEACQTNRIKLVLATYSMAADAQTPPEVVRFYQMGYPLAPWQIQANVVHSAIVRQLAAQYPEVCLVDTHPHLDGEHDKFIDLVHFDPAGDQQMAETFFAALKHILEEDLLRF